MKRTKFCPKCGKETEDLHNGLCVNCFGGRIGLGDDFPQKVVVYTCKECGKLFTGDKGYQSQEPAIEEFIKKTMKKRDANSVNYRIEGDILRIYARVEAAMVEKDVEESLNIIRKMMTCKMCSLQKASYFNSTLQVRVPKEMEDAIVAEIKTEMKRLNKTNKYAFISVERKLKEGIDFLVGSKAAVDTVSDLMRKRHGAKIKFSRKLYGLIEGKKSYRDTVLVSIEK